MRPRAKELRRIARQNQNKHYWWAVLVTLVAALLGGAGAMLGGPQLNFNINFSFPADFGGFYGSDPDAVFSQIETLWRQLLPWFGVIAAIASITSVIAIASIVLAGPVCWGYSRYCLQMHDGECTAPFQTLFSGFQHFGKTLGLYWWITLKVFLWELIAFGAMFVCMLIAIPVMVVTFTNTPSYLYADSILELLPMIRILSAVLLVVYFAALIPAFRAAYSYSMAFYLMVENPNLRVTDAVRCSINLMRGHKWRLFCLDLSFIGWDILNALTFGILGLLFLNPYQQFARTAFYRDLVKADPASRLWANAAPYPVPPTGCQPGTLPPQTAAPVIPNPPVLNAPAPLDASAPQNGPAPLDIPAPQDAPAADAPGNTAPPAASGDVPPAPQPPVASEESPAE